MQFVIFHGSFGNSSSNWFPYLKENLEKIGQKILVPEFPIENWDEFTKNGENQVAKIQNLENWLAVFEKEYIKLDDKNNLCFIGHSVGCVFILHILKKFNIKLDSSIFVSPFLTLDPDIWQYRIVNKTFNKSDFDFGKLKTQIPVSYVFYGSNDPYVKPEIAEEFADKLGSKKIKVENGGHLNSESRFARFPQLFEFCQIRIKSRMYNP